MQGYIKDHRKELNSDIWAMPPLYHRVWQWLKYQVNHNDAEIPMNDGTKLHIKKGQHLTSIRKIARGVGYYEKGLWEEPNPRTVDRILKWMVKNNMIIVENGNANRQYTLITILNWETYQMEESLKKDPSDIPKEKPKKKDSKVKYPEGSPYYNMATYFHGKVSKVAEEAGVSHLVNKADMQKWADEFRKLIELNKVDKHLAKEIMDWVVTDKFWRKNVLSAKKFREQFAKLAIQYNEKQSSFPQNNPQKKDFRDKDIAFSKFVAAGGDPSEFDWSS